MKQLFKFIECLQQEYIAKIKDKETELQLTGVAGVNLGGNISTTQYVDILKNIEGYIKDHRRYKQDPTKIVVEKNSAMRALKGGKFVFFRKLDSTNGCIMNGSNENISRMSYEKGVFLGVGVILAIFIFAFGVNSLEHGASLIFPLLLFITEYVKRNKFKKWLRKMKKDPNGLFNNEVTTTKKRGLDCFSMKVNLEIGSLSDDICELQNDASALSTRWYNQTLKESIGIAAKTGGVVGWIWNYADQLVDNYEFSSEGNNSCSVSIKNYSDNILFFIETDYSLIFHFPEGYKGHGGFERALTETERNSIENRFEKKKETMFCTFEQFN